MIAAPRNGSVLGNRATFAAKFADEMQAVANSTESGSDWDSQSIASDASDDLKQPYVALATPCTPWIDTAPRGVFAASNAVPAEQRSAPSQRNVARQPSPKYEYQQAPAEYINRPQQEYGYGQPEYDQPAGMVSMQMQLQQQMQQQMQEQQLQMMRQMQQQMQQQWMNSMPPMVIPVPVAVPAALKPPQVQVPFGYQLVRQEKPMLEDLLPGQTRGVRRRRNTRPRRDQAGGSGGSGAAKVFVGGLSPHSTADTLREHFEKFGVISDCAVINEPGTRKSRGFGFVEFAEGIPEGLLQQEHIVGQRRCGVRPYDYAAKVESENEEA